MHAMRLIVSPTRDMMSCTSTSTSTSRRLIHPTTKDAIPSFMPLDDSLNEESCDASAEEEEDNQELSDTDSVPSHNVTLTAVPDREHLINTSNAFEDEEEDLDQLNHKGGFCHSSPMKDQQHTDISEAELSDFWDQEKYLSEHNYEEVIDEDSARRLLNFGDDYRNFIDSLSEGPSSFPESQSTRSSRKNRKKNKDIKDPDCESLSDVEINNTNDVLQRSEVKYCSVKREILKKQIFSESRHTLERLVDTCKENISLITFLADRKNQLNPKYKKAVRNAKTLRKRWTRLLEVSELKVKLVDKLSDLETNIESCRQKIDSILDNDQSSSEKEISSWQKDILDCQRELELTKASIETLEDLKNELFHINLETHNLNAETQELLRKVGVFDDISSTSAIVDHESPVQLQSVQESVITLYEKWDDALFSKKRRLIDVENAIEIYSRMQQEQIARNQLEVEEVKKRKRNGKTNKDHPQCATSSKDQESNSKRSSSVFLKPFLMIQATLALMVLLLFSFDQPSCCDGHANFGEYGFFYLLRSQEQPPL